MIFENLTADCYNDKIGSQKSAALLKMISDSDKVGTVQRAPKTSRSIKYVVLGKNPPFTA